MNLEEFIETACDCEFCNSFLWREPPQPPVVGLDMDEDGEHRRQIELLMGQIMSPIYRIQGLVSAVTAR